MDTLILMIGGYLILMDLQMHSLMTKVNGTTQMTMAMAITSNISMEKHGVKLGEAMVAYQPRVIQPWIAGDVRILMVTDGQIQPHTGLLALEVLLMLGQMM